MWAFIARIEHDWLIIIHFINKLILQEKSKRSDEAMRMAVDGNDCEHNTFSDNWISLSICDQKSLTLWKSICDNWTEMKKKSTRISLLVFSFYFPFDSMSHWHSVEFHSDWSHQVIIFLFCAHTHTRMHNETFDPSEHFECVNVSDKINWEKVSISTESIHFTILLCSNWPSFYFIHFFPSDFLKINFVVIVMK